METREVQKEVKVTVPSEAPTITSADDSQPSMDIQGEEEQIRVVEKQVRVAFIGWPEKYDEWLDVMSDRLAPLDSKSYGKRGELAIRKEIKFVVPQAKPADPGLFAVQTHPQFYSKYYVGVVQSFGEQGGFDMICRRLQVEELPLPLLTRLKLFQAIGMPDELYTPFFFQTNYEWFKKLLTTTVFTIPETDLRNIDRDLLQGVLKSLENMSAAGWGRTAQTMQLYEQVHLGIARKCIISPYLNRRLDGLKLLNDFVTRIENTEVTFPCARHVQQPIVLDFV